MKARTAWLLLAVILVGALGVRLWYASYRPDGGRFWDERYARENVHSILNEGTLEPASTYYPSPVFNLPAAGLVAASERLHEITGWQAFDVVRGTWLRPPGYLLLRGLQCVVGTASVLMMFLLARTLLGRTASLLASLIFAFMPWQIHTSGYFKPDQLLVLTTLLTLYWSVRAIQRPGWGRAALAGFGVALAASAKLTGVLTAAPLTLGLLLLARRDRRRLGELLLAGAASAASFMLMNPHWRSYLNWAASLTEDYAMRARWQGMTSWQMPWRTIGFLADPYTLGILGAVLAVAAMAVAIVALRRIGDPTRRAAAVALIGFPVLWVGAYALQTPYFKPNNMLPITPVMILLLTAALTAIFDLARSRWPRLGSPAVVVLVIATLAWFWVRPGLLYAYDTVTRTTLEAMNHQLRERGVLSAGRFVVHETGVVPARQRNGSVIEGRAAATEVEDLSEASAELLRGSDAVIAPAKRMNRPETRAALEALPEVNRETIRVNPRLGRLRGPPLVAEIVPWKKVGRPIQLELESCGDDCWTALVPKSDLSGEVGSIAVWLKTRPYREARPPRLLLAGRDLPLFATNFRARARYYGTARFPLSTEPLPLRVEGGSFAGEIAIALHRWRRP